jgi:hypothetical protein
MHLVCRMQILASCATSFHLRGIALNSKCSIVVSHVFGDCPFALVFCTDARKTTARILASKRNDRDKRNRLHPTGCATNACVSLQATRNSCSVIIRNLVHTVDSGSLISTIRTRAEGVVKFPVRMFEHISFS